MGNVESCNDFVILCGIENKSFIFFVSERNMKIYFSIDVCFFKDLFLLLFEFWYLYVVIW